MARTLRAAGSRPPAAPRGKQPRGRRGGAALARGPLGIIIAIFGLAQVGLGLAARSTNLPQGTATLLVVAMIVLALAAMSAFLYAWLARPGILYPPTDFTDQKMWLRAVGLEDVVPSTPLVLDQIGPPPQPADSMPLDPTFLRQSAVELQRGSPSSTSIMELARCLTEATGWGYLLVDVGEGNHWLLSRLFGFITIYARQRPLPCVVFVRDGRDGQRLLGIADPAQLCGSLARLYPWFNTKLAELILGQNLPVFGTAPVDEWTAVNLLTDFIQRLQDSNSHAEMLSGRRCRPTFGSKRFGCAKRC
jgi:hypothetical protein